MKPDWAKLPKDVLALIFDKLVKNSDHSTMLTSVCTSWNRIANQESIDIKMKTPVLLISDKRRKDTWKAYNAIHDEVLGSQLRLPHKRFCGSSNGWLISVDENRIVTLTNPLFRIKGKRVRENSIILLPPLNPPNYYNGCKYRHSDFFVIKATISADPILKANDCIVVVTYEPFCQVAFTRLGKDTEWTYSGYKSCPFIDDFAQIGHIIYALDGWGRLFASEYGMIQAMSTSEVRVVAYGFPYDDNQSKSYLVGSNEREFMMVRRYCSYYGRRMTRRFRVFKLDSDKHKWFEINDLGDVALFVGDNSTISVVASKSSKFEPNCIYFYHDHDRVGRKGNFKDYGVYDMNSNSISQAYNGNAKSLLKRTRQPPIWFLPIA